jgi:hypothetical protein
MMAWVAFDRAILIAKKLRTKAPIERWKKLRDTIHEEICRKAFDKEKNAFVQYYGAKHLDAALLLMPIVGFLPATDRRVRGTIEAIERELMDGGFVLRYDTEIVQDGLPPGEGAFLACSFWMVSALKAIGREQDARTLFNRLLALRNDLGLLSEEYDVDRKRLVGNFPPGLLPHLTHQRRLRPRTQRRHRPPSPPPQPRRSCIEAMNEQPQKTSATYQGATLKRANATDRPPRIGPMHQGSPKTKKNNHHTPNPAKARFTPQQADDSRGIQRSMRIDPSSHRKYRLVPFWETKFQLHLRPFFRTFKSCFNFKKAEQ